ncbi:Nitrate/nitrite transporter NarK [Geoalkalibacter ferrihydriticus]|uniref:MFS transporter n=2 Tax=Geoalkalibacter ferrihydriticus TaxID=392333 RepID=A0A0C2HH87_9BACT|nr:OFA family MFS transporter [Geoalkalibacter ferrihydriticus]KIH76351.1 MFS transporter [Geoalkalibacter ferrihydriticus DSM 17813]SDL28167.1 Nitrate/nitrite transporter NarK [Geoalkalibacter ferrihydriticus]
MNATQTSNRKGWTVVLAGTGINLALGILYTWSIFRGAIADSVAQGGAGAFNWNPAAINDPYAVCCLVFAFSMILAGKCQDKFGPRLTIMIGGLLVASGFVLVSQSTAYWAWVLGFGVMAGAGIGFGYSAATPPALKWFPPAKTGLIAGIVVSGFGLASVYIAPLAQYMLGAYGLQQSMLIFGVAFAVLVSGLALLVTNPPKGYVPVGAPAQTAAASTAAPAKPSVDMTPSQLFKSGQFYTLWMVFFIGAGAGLMVIGSVAGMAKASMGTLAFLAVAILAIGNAAGRIVAGIVSDKIGRANTLIIMLVLQASLMFAAIPVIGNQGTSAVVIVLLATFIGFNYGTNLALFPSFAKDLWGLKNFGMNYGILFTSWGVGGFVLVRLSEMLRAQTGSFAMPFAVAGVLLLVGAMLSLSLRPKKVEALATAPAAAPVEEEELVFQKAD